jgi:hypothetical protein
MTVKNFGKQTPAVATLSITSSSLKLPKKSLITSALKQQLGKNWQAGKLIYFETEDLK